MAINIVFNGTSITAGNGTSSWANTFAVVALSGTTLTSLAVSGSTIADIVGRQSTALALYVPGALNLYACEAGANNFLNGNTVADDAATAALFAHYDAMRAGGFKVIDTTLLPQARGGATTTNFVAARALYNPQRRSAVGVHSDAIIDWAVNPLIGPDSAAFDATYFDQADHLHPNKTGQGVMLQDARYVSNTFISPTARRFRLIS